MKNESELRGQIEVQRKIIRQHEDSIRQCEGVIAGCQYALGELDPKPDPLAMWIKDNSAAYNRAIDRYNLYGISEG